MTVCPWPSNYELVEQGQQPFWKVCQNHLGPSLARILTLHPDATISVAIVLDPAPCDVPTTMDVPL